MQRLRNSVLNLRQKNIEFLFEDKTKAIRGSSLKLIGYQLLESAYHLYLLFPGIIYANEIRKSGTVSEIKKRAYESLLAKGYEKDTVKNFIDNINV